jgi:hypothetical protein
VPCRKWKCYKTSRADAFSFQNQDEINGKVQTVAVFGISPIALGKYLGIEMKFRSFNHFLQYGDVSLKKGVLCYDSSKVGYNI